MTKEEVLPILQKSVSETFPSLPEAKEIFSHKWLYSQPTSSILQKEGFIYVNKNVALFGDGFCERGNFDGCIQSASKIAQHLKEKYNL